MKELANGHKWKFAFYTVTHPMKGFYEIRHRGEGSVAIAFVLVVLFSISFSINRYAASFIVNDINPLSVNALPELISVLLLYILFSVGNWSVTCLMNGEGRFKDILTIVGYSMIPMIFTYNIGTIMSQFVTKDEASFYSIVVGLGIAWAVIMVLMGIMTIHNYSLGKTIITIFITFVAMFIIIFVVLLLANLITQVYSFFRSIYQELLFRT